MGMLRQGNATSEENGPSLGRGLGVGSTAEQAMSNSPLKAENPAQKQDMPKMPGMQPQGMPLIQALRQVRVPFRDSNWPGR